MVVVSPEDDDVAASGSGGRAKGWPWVESEAEEPLALASSAAGGALNVAFSGAGDVLSVGWCWRWLSSGDVCSCWSVGSALAAPSAAVDLAVEEEEGGGGGENGDWDVDDVLILLFNVKVLLVAGAATAVSAGEVLGGRRVRGFLRGAYKRGMKPDDALIWALSRKYLSRLRVGCVRFGDGGGSMVVCEVVSVLR